MCLLFHSFDTFKTGPVIGTLSKPVFIPELQNN